VDGNNVQPLVVNSIQIFVAQRYSFILTADQPVNNYWIRALSSEANATFDNGLNSAILRYEGAPDIDPTTSQNITNPLVETNLHPLTAPAAPGIPEPGAADVNLNLNIQFDLTALEYTVNNATFIPPTLPVLLQIISGAMTPQQLLPPGDVYTLPPNKVIEISMPGGSPGSPVSHKHPLITFSY
jgi:iron transport multicopper oxidase